jgi:hypothetical protein
MRLTPKAPTMRLTPKAPALRPTTQPQPHPRETPPR